MMIATIKRSTLVGIGIILVALAIVGFTVIIKTVFASEAKETKPHEPQAMPVEVTIIEEKAMRLWKNFSGRLSAVDYVEIRPQTTGLITEIRFEDGQFVNKGDILFIIDPRPLEATVAKAKAELMTAHNHYQFSEKEYTRAKNLVATKVISQHIYDERINEKLIAESRVKSAEAELLRAEINLSYAYIKAPVSGIVSRAEVTEGNLVSTGPNTPLLTSIVSSTNIYADFEIDEKTYLRYSRNLSTNKKVTNTIPVELRLQSDDEVYQGKIHAFDNKIDSASGTIRARAIFANPQGKLLPGMYAHLRLGSSSEEKKILINERAIATDQNRKFVYVVNKQNMTNYREVKLGESIDGDRIINAGLAAGDKVIIRGLIRIRPNMLVEPQTLATKASEPE